MATQLKPVFATAKPRSSLSDNIRPYLAEIAKRSPATEKARMVPPENVELLKKAGFMRAFLPAVLGGDERDIQDFCDGVRLVTKACPATGWITGILNVHPPVVARFHPDVQREVWATGPDTVICTSGSPTIKAELADGGIIATGRGRWASGCDHAEWALIGVKVPNVSDSAYPERNYHDYWFIAHRSQYTIDDTWYSTGQRGSGSKDLVFDKLFVPYKRMERLDSLNFGTSKGAGTVDSWLARMPFMLFSGFLPSIALGCADGMIEEFTKRQKARKNANNGAQGILNPAGYMRMVESEHELASLSAFQREVIAEQQAFGKSGEKITEGMFMNTMARLSFITDRTIDVIERLFRAAGSSAIADFNKMQRYWRDGYTVRLHTAMDYDVNAQRYGRSMIGLPPTGDI